MHYAPGKEDCPLPFSPFKSCTVPRPIGWLSTISKDGVPNLAPYSQWQNLTFDPPMVMFAANQLSSGERKHTVVNAEETGWFVWNMATYDLREAVNISAMELEANEDEFLRAGVTPVSCIDAPCPRVKESPAHFECRYCVAIPPMVGLRLFMAKWCAFMLMMMCSPPKARWIFPEFGLWPDWDTMIIPLSQMSLRCGYPMRPAMPQMG